MPAPLLRKKPGTQTDMFDPTSAATWAAGAKATAAIVSMIDLLKLNPNHAQTARDIATQLKAATALTPCALTRDARTKPYRQWGFSDYVLAVKVYEALRDVFAEGVKRVPPGFDLFDSTREAAAQDIIAFAESIEVYAKLVKRERAYERLSGERSGRRG